MIDQDKAAKSEKIRVGVRQSHLLGHAQEGWGDQCVVGAHNVTSFTLDLGIPSRSFNVGRASLFCYHIRDRVRARAGKC